MKTSNEMKNKMIKWITRSAIIAPAFVGLSAFAQATTTPGVPSTGAGGSLPANIALMAVAIVAIVLGALQLTKPGKQS